MDKIKNESALEILIRKGQLDFKFLATLGARNDHWVQETASYTPQDKYSLPPVLANNQLLEQNLLIHWCIIYGCFCASTVALSNCERDCMSCKI